MHSSTNDTQTEGLGPFQDRRLHGSGSAAERRGVARFLSQYRTAASRGRPALAWVAVGFLSGALFWHIVGFWDFVSGVVWNDGDMTAAFSRPEAVAGESLPEEPASHQEGCSAAARTATVAQLGPCSDRWTPILALGHRERQDKLSALAKTRALQQPPKPPGSADADLDLSWDTNVR